LASGHLEVTGSTVIDGAFVFAMDSIDASSFGNDGLKTILEDDLKSDKFFAVDRYPYARYRVTS